jgi:hypothetical protein
MSIAPAPGICLPDPNGPLHRGLETGLKKEIEARAKKYLK